MDEEINEALIVDGVNFRRLFRAIEHSYEVTKWARTLTHRLVKEFAGPAYGAQGGPNKPLNKMYQLVDAYMMLTAANRPTAHITSKLYKQFARLYQDSINNLATEIKLEQTLRQWVMDAFFGIGVIKVHRDKYRMMPFGDTRIDPGTPSASSVPIDDWVYDTRAKEWPQIQYCGDKYRIPFSRLEQWVTDGIADPAVVAQLSPTTKQGNEDKRLDKISTGEITDDDELEPMIDLADIWLQQTGRIYTCAISDASTFRLKRLKPIAFIDWNDPDNPPHHILRFSEVPHNIMPIAPAAHMDLLDRSINNVANKEIRRVENQKDTILYDPAGEETARNVKNSGDLEMVRGRPGEIQLVKSGGIDSNMHQMLLALNEFFDMMAGNLPAIAGLGPSAGTFGQEQLIANASNKKVASMQAKVAASATGLFRSLGFMLWEDELREIVNEITVGPYSTTDTWRPGEREGNYLDYNFQINVHNLTLNPPAAQAELLMAVMERVFIPMQQAIMAQGGQLDWAVVSEKLSTLLNMPELEEVIKWATPPDTAQTTGTTAVKPPSTSRNYTRTSVPSQGTSHSRLYEGLQAMQAQVAPGGVQ